MFTPEQIERICHKIAIERMTIRQIAESEGFSHSLIIKYATENLDFGNQYAHALLISNDADLIDFEADLDVKPPVVDGRVDPGWVNWKRSVRDDRKWLLSKRNPKKYGDKQQVDVSGEVEVKYVVNSNL